MQNVSYPEGHTYHTALWCRGDFWVITKQQTNDNTYRAFRPDGFSQEVVVPPSPVHYFNIPMMIDHPKMPGLSLAWFTPTESTAHHVVSGQRFQVTKETRPAIGREGGTANYRDVWQWREKHIGPWKVGHWGRDRAAWNDQQVVMTGSHAIANASLVLGPTAAQGILSVKGLKACHVVAATRGGGTRVMRLPKSNNAKHLVLAPDGLTFLAACLHAAFLIDFDTA